MKPFDKLLIANRGEIACRIIRTAHALGINTIAVFSEADANSLHVKMATEAYLIGKAASKESYLNIDKIISIAKQAGADAIHPGYGFLSENSHFATACDNENIIFVGPPAAAINAMANKNIAKEIMQAHGVPTLPGFFAENASLASLQKAAESISYPIVLKAVAGGGGKGLRLVHDSAQLASAYEAVKREAKAFFNDDRILIEKYLSHARHIEVQILADHYGNVVPIFTRDCSIQRRHQKIIEEAPAPNLPTTLQQEMLAAGVNAAAAIQYTNAGTIEFLVQDDQFYFMEMNTRLQVEHPVTEMITQLDLVEWQLRIAAGEKINLDSLSSKGHAIEVRLNAEDPENDFLPSAGKLAYFQIAQDLLLRIDSGYEEGDEVNIYYDSLLAKIIMWGENRSQAIERLHAVLNNTFIFGINTNLTLLKIILGNDDFIRSTFDTHFLQKKELSKDNCFIEEALGISALLLFLLRQEKDSIDITNPWSLHDNWRLYFPPQAIFQFQYKHTPSMVTVTKIDHGFEVKTANQTVYCQQPMLKKIKDQIYQLRLLVNEASLCALFYVTPSKLALFLGSEHYQIEIIQDSIDNQHHIHEDQLLAPMPGTLVALLVNKGQQVSKGEKLLVIEAMKMEHTLYAPKDGIVKHCHYQIGDLVKEGSELIEFD